MKNSICSACWQGWKHIMAWCGVSDRYGRSGLVTVRSLIITSVLGTAVQLYSAVQCGAVHCTVLQPLSVSERLSSDRTASERFTIFSAPTKYFCGGSDGCVRCQHVRAWLRGRGGAQHGRHAHPRVRQPLSASVCCF